MKSVVVKGRVTNRCKKKAMNNSVPLVVVRKVHDGYSLIQYDTDSVFSKCNEEEWDKIHYQMACMEDIQTPVVYSEEVKVIDLNAFNLCILNTLLAKDIRVRVVNYVNKSNNFYYVLGGPTAPEVMVHSEDVNKAIEIMDNVWYNFFGYVIGNK